MKHMLSTLLRAGITCALATMVALPVSAAVVINGTRVVYNTGARDVTVQLSNRGEVPALVQAWIDTGDSKAPLETLVVPFTMTPPMFRLDPEKTQLLRLIYTGSPPAEGAVEQVYWLNVLEVPPKPDASAGGNTLQFALRSRIKLFLRPSSLGGQDATDKVIQQLQWRHEVDGQVLKLTVSNPTPYHASLVDIAPTGPDKSVLAEPVNGMVEPGASKVFEFKLDAAKRAEARAVNFKAINDYGATVDGTAPLQ